jgi:DNA-binding CsgD family transcriptional regulator
VGVARNSIQRIRQAVQLVGEVHELGATTEAGRGHLARGLLDLLGAELGGVIRDEAYAPTLTCGMTGGTLVQFDAATFAIFSTHHTFGSAVNPYHRAAMRILARAPIGATLTGTSAQLARTTWGGSAWVNEYVRPTRLEHFIASTRRFGPTSCEGIAFMRSRRDRPFGDAERELLHLVHLGIRRAFDTPAPTQHHALAAPVARLGKLTVREREVADLVARGLRNSEIAHVLGTSPATVRNQIHTIFQKCDVTTRAELVACLLSNSV